MNNKMDTENDVGGNCDGVCSNKTNALATMFSSGASGGGSNSGGGSSNSNNNNSNASNNNNNVSSNHIEQPQTKRQKIDKYIKCNTKHSSKAAGPTLPAGAALNHTPPPPDILDTGEKCPSSSASSSECAQHLCSSLSSSAHSISTPSGSSSNTSPTSTPSSSRATSLTHLLNVQSHLATILPHPASSNIASAAAAAKEMATTGAASSMGASETRHSCSGTTSSGCSSADQSADEVDRVVAGSRMPDLLPLAPSGAAARTKPPSSAATTAPASSSADEASAAQDMREFEESLVKQCLCGVPERMLRKPFQSHYSISANGQKRIANLSEWPTNKLLQFLSNLQLLFDIYLRQNSKGFICGRIMDVCDALIRNDQNLIDEIIVLAGYGNAYVQFLAGRVLASFLVIAKQEMDNDWLKKLVENLFNFDRLDHLAIQKIHFSLEIIKRIVVHFSLTFNLYQFVCKAFKFV